MLIPDRPGATCRTEGDLFTAAFQFECVARFQLQFLSQGLGNDDAASLVDNETGIHIDIIMWVNPLLNTISYGASIVRRLSLYADMRPLPREAFLATIWRAAFAPGRVRLIVALFAVASSGRGRS